VQVLSSSTTYTCTHTIMKPMHVLRSLHCISPHIPRKSLSETDTCEDNQQQQIQVRRQSGPETKVVSGSWACHQTWNEGHGRQRPLLRKQHRAAYGNRCRVMPLHPRLPQDVPAHGSNTTSSSCIILPWLPKMKTGHLHVLQCFQCDQRKLALTTWPLLLHTQSCHREVTYVHVTISHDNLISGTQSCSYTS